MLGGIRKLITFCLVAVISLASVGGVYASWIYYQPTQELVNEIKPSLYPWKGVEILPTETEDGANHLTLLENLKRNLNSTNSSVQAEINKRVNNSGWTGGPKDDFGSMAIKNNDGLLQDLLPEGSKNLNVLIYFPETETENVDKSNLDTYYVFTTSVNLGHKGGQWQIIGVIKTKDGVHFFWEGGETKHRIYEIYRTKLQKLQDTEDIDGDGNKTEKLWQEVSVDVGSAEPCWYEESLLMSTNGQIPSFDPATYKTEQELPIATKDNPAYTYLNYTTIDSHGYEGQTVKTFLSFSDEEKWYQLVPEMADGTTSGTVTLTLAEENKDCILNVYSAQKEVALATNAGDGKVSFTAQAGTTYYIKVSGATAIEYTVSFTPN